MPVYEYQAEDPGRGCPHCRERFEVLHKTLEPLTVCPACGGPVRKLLSVYGVGASASGLDDRARRAGFTKLKRLGKGEYEKQY